MKIHEIEKCNYCTKIIAMFVFSGPKELRFNQLKKQATNIIDLTIGDPTLIRHLRNLNQKGIITRTRKGPQNIVYSLKPQYFGLFEKELKWWRLIEPSFKNLTLDGLVDFTLQQAKLRQLKRMMTLLQILNRQGKIENLILELKLNTQWFVDTDKRIIEALRGHTEQEYALAILQIKNSIDRIQKGVTE